MKVLALSYGWTPRLERTLLRLIPRESSSAGTIGICCNAYRFRLVRQVVGLWKKVVFARLGYATVYLDLSLVSGTQMIKLQSRFDNLYLSHGDARLLKSAWERTELGAALIAHIRERNGTVIGESAGTILLGSSIATSDFLGDKKRVKLVNLKGFNFFPTGCSFFPHCRDAMHEAYERAVTALAPSKVIALQDGEGYVLHDDGTEARIKR